MSKHFRRAIGLENLLVVALGIVSIFLSTYHLSIYPPIGFDEGWFLQSPKNLVLYGKYAIRSSEGFRWFEMATTGPTALLPIAAIFQLLGVGLLQARLVMALYTLLAITVFYLLSLHICDKGTAIAASFLLITTSWPNIFDLGRQVRGEVPAFFLLLVGTLFWWKSFEDSRVWVSLASGLAFGLAVVTKPQMMLIWAVLFVTWIANVFYYRKLNTSHFALPLIASVGCFAVWQVFQLVFLGEDGFSTMWVVNSSGVVVTLIIFSVEKILSNTKVLVANAGYVSWGVPALLYAFTLALNNKTQWGIKQFFQVALVAIWLCWYLILSVGWDRYAFTATAWTALFIAHLFHDLTNGFSIEWRKAGHTTSAEGGKHNHIAKLCLLLVLMWIIAHPLQQRIRATLSTDDRTSQQFANYLITHVNESVLIESCEMGIAFLTNHNYHHPTAEVIVALAKKLHFGLPYPVDAYNFQEYDPDYLINGPFSKWTGLYPESFLSQNCTLLKTIGNYDLYKMKKVPATDPR